MSSDFPDALRHLRRVLDDPQARGIDDAVLVERFVVHRDEAAFELLLWRHAGMVMGVCRAILRDHHLAEDAFQATFLALARKAGSIRRRTVLAGWLHRVAHHAALKARGRQARDASEPLLDEPVAPPVSIPDDQAALLHEELGRLPDRYRLPLVLCFFEGLSHTDAARLLGWPRGTVAGRIARARDVLRQRLARRGILLSAGLFATALTPAISGAAPPTLVSATVQASLAFVSGNAGGVSLPVLRLTEGVLHTMLLAKLKSVALVVCVLTCLVLGGWGTLAIAEKAPAQVGAAASPREPEKKDAAREVQKLKARSINNLKQIAIAAHNHLNEANHLPGNILGPDKKPLLSWRVRLLPYLEQNDLYRKFKLDEPWDSEHNRKLLSSIPDVYRTGAEPRNSTDTYYQGFAGDDTLFPPGRPPGVIDIPDGMSMVVLVLEAGTAVPWTKPEDLPYAANKPIPKLGGPFKDVIHSVFADGVVHPLKRDYDEKLLRLVITRNDHENLDINKLRAYPPLPRKPERLTPEQAARQAEVAARLMAEVAAQEAERSRALADATRRDAEVLKQKTEKLRTELQEVVAQLEKLDRKPAADDVKGLKEELERTRAEVRRLREKVKRLEQALGK